MYKIQGTKAIRVEPVTFSELNMIESDVEELLRTNIDMVCDEEESMLIVGRQVRNAQHGRSDLTAVDNNGNIVLIEIKKETEKILNPVKKSLNFKRFAMRPAMQQFRKHGDGSCVPLINSNCRLQVY